MGSEMCIRDRYDELEGCWRLSPAYDLTYIYSLGGEHATMVHGNGRDPGLTDLLAVAKNAGINERRAKRIAQEIQECVNERLARWLRK